MKVISSGDPLTPLICLQGMAEVLSSPERYNKGRIAARADGTSTISTDIQAVRWSISGALHAVLAFYPSRWNQGFPGKVEKLLSEAAGRDYADFDYDPHTTFDDVRRCLDVAITMA